MSVTLITEEVKYRERTGFNAYTIPGCINWIEVSVETLEGCISRVMNVDTNRCTRKKEVIYAKHLVRYCLERLSTDGKIITEPRGCNRSLFRYDLNQIAAYCGCDHASIFHSSKAAQNLIETNKDYKAMASIVFKKIESNLIKFPELD